MTLDQEDLENRLRAAPADWEARLALVEWHVFQGDKASARKVVRESPDEGPLPSDVQFRIHTLLTRPVREAEKPGEEGKSPGNSTASASDRMETQDKGEPHAGSPNSRPPAPKTEAPEPPTTVAPSPEDEGTKEHSRLSLENKESLEWARSRQKKRRLRGEKVCDLPEDLDHTDARAPIKAFRAAVPDTPAHLAPAPLVRPKKTDHAVIRARSGPLEIPEPSEDDLLLSEMPPIDRPAGTAEKIGAFTLAMIVHAAIVVALSFVVIALPIIQPPQLVVNTQSDRDQLIIDQKKLVKPTDKPMPSAAAPHEAFIISSTAPSNMTVPDFENKRTVDLVSPIAGLQIDGMGFSFNGKSGDTSDVNFFGIKSGGNRIVFIIDTAPGMLVDEKGGMFAYDKVKNEIGIMLNALNRGTSFNIILYQGARAASFREKPIPGLPSNIRQALDWMDPVNRTYEDLGLSGDYMANPVVLTDGVGPIKAAECLGYTKAIQAAMEMDANAIFCIAGGYETIRRQADEETRKKMRENPGTPGKVDPKEREAWQQAVDKTQVWLAKENAARAEKGLPPKVVLNFSQLVREVTGATPPRAVGGTPSPVKMPSIPPYTPEEIEQHLREISKAVVRRSPGSSEPSVHLVLFLGKGEDIGDQEEHFKRLTRQNHGKLKLLRGLEALKNVTGSQ